MNATLGSVGKVPRKPDWIRIKVSHSPRMGEVARVIKKYALNTVCESARCPNIYECWGSGTATIMILGDVCTRYCRFCSVKRGDPKGHVDSTEPIRVAMAIKELGLKYAVITSVDRDDLKDGGASVFAETILRIRELCRDTVIEVLIPDFNGDEGALNKVIDAMPDVIGHNIETVRRLTPVVRDRRAGYEKSLKVLRYVKERNPNIYTKSGLILGFGETIEEVVETLKDLKDAGVDIVTIGQYLQPTLSSYPVREFVSPGRFKELEDIGYSLGFKCVISGPRVRSSYRASEHFFMKVKGTSS